MRSKEMTEDQIIMQINSIGKKKTRRFIMQILFPFYVADDVRLRIMTDINGMNMLSARFLFLTYYFMNVQALLTLNKTVNNLSKGKAFLMTTAL